MTEKLIHISPRKILTCLGLVLLLFSGYCSYAFSVCHPAFTGSVPVSGQKYTADTHYAASTFFSYDILDEIVMAEEVKSDDNLPENTCKISPLLFEQAFDLKHSIFNAHINECVHNRHLYLLYCSWRHFIFL